MPLKFQRYERDHLINEHPYKMHILSMLFIVLGPLFVMFVNLRCEKNQCVLMQFPMVVPTHLSAYFSASSATLLAGFLLVMLLVNRISTTEQVKGKKKLSPTAAFVLCASILLACVAYMKPECVLLLRSEYLRLLSTTIIFCFAFSLGLALFFKFNWIQKEKEHYSFMVGFFNGYNAQVRLGKVELKYYFFVNVGLVMWALIDLLIFTSYVLQKPVTAPLIFIFASQYLYIIHTLIFEKFLTNKPFIHTEGLGLSWLMRVLIFTPFMFSLPLLYASATEAVIPKPAMLANSCFFLFGFLIYISALHQRENFNVSYASQSQKTGLKTISTNVGKRLLISGYWGTVQKPDYLGYLIMWLSWTVACGFSAVAFIVLMIVIGVVLFWLNQREHYHKSRYGVPWGRYTATVPHKIIPMVY